MPGDQKAGSDNAGKVDPAVSDEAGIDSPHIPKDTQKDTPKDAQSNLKGDTGTGNDTNTSDVNHDGELESGTDQQSADVLDFGDERMQPAETPEADLESDDPVALKAKLASEVERADGNWERVLRMQADMENLRKRLQKDVENARKFALEAVVNDLLPVKDSLEMGILAARETDADPEKIVEGTDLTLKMLSQAFEKYNIIEINPIDEKFDPEFHQAMSVQEIEGKEPNTVTSVLQKGYTLNNRLIRPALVMVSK